MNAGNLHTSRYWTVAGLRLCALLGLTLATPAHAQSAATTSSLLGRPAAELTAALSQVPEGALVAFAALQSDTPSIRSDELASRVASSIAANLTAAQVYREPVSISRARALSTSARSLLFVRSEVRKGELRVTIDVYPVLKNSWERLRTHAMAPLAHAFVARPLDAEMRSFFPPILLEQSTLRRHPHDEGEVLAIACGDLDGDGGLEVAIASRERISLGRFRNGAFFTEKSIAWPALKSRAAAPLREPIATLNFIKGKNGLTHLFAGVSDRGGVAIDANFQKTSLLTGIPLALGSNVRCAAGSPETGALDSILGTCEPLVRSAIGEEANATKAVEPWVLPATRFDAFAAMELISQTGRRSELTAVRDPNGRLKLRSGDNVQALDNMGAQVAVGDLDLDGIAEIVTSLDTRNAEEDALLVFSWEQSGVRQRLRLKAPGGVRAVAICPPEAGARPGWIAAVGPGEAGKSASADTARAEVWLVR
jgi:hypothetical protein